MKALWILIQVNAVFALLAFGSTGMSGVGEKQLILSGISLMLAAFIEYLGYKYIYKASKE